MCVRITHVVYLCSYVCTYIITYVSMYIRTYVGIDVNMYVYVCVRRCLDLLRKQSNKAFRSHSCENYQQIIWALCEIAGFLCGVIEAVYLLGCYAAILLDVYRRFGTFYWFHLQDDISQKNEGLKRCSGSLQGLRPKNFPQ